MKSDATFSPRARGWTALQDRLIGLRESFPRERGDGPKKTDFAGGGRKFSPRARGWTERRRTCADIRHRFPRERGDGPSSCRLLIRSYQFSPRARGWTDAQVGREVRGHRFPRERGDGPPLCGHSYTYRIVFPASAGMDRVAASSWLRPTYVFPASAGMDRARAQVRGTACAFSPRARGWTVTTGTGQRDRTSFPRERGDGPLYCLPVATKASVFPASAGMDRKGVGGIALPETFSPRARGWTAHHDVLEPEDPAFSPRARGWTAFEVIQCVKEFVFPASAGMDRAIWRITA